MSVKSISAIILSIIILVGALTIICIYKKNSTDKLSVSPYTENITAENTKVENTKNENADVDNVDDKLNIYPKEYDW